MEAEDSLEPCILDKSEAVAVGKGTDIPLAVEIVVPVSSLAEEGRW